MTSDSAFTFARATLVVLGVALILRIAWAAAIPVVPISDSVAYDTLARTLAEHDVYGWTADQPSAYWPVGTSAIYAALYKVYGHSFTPIVVLNVIFGTAIVALTMRLGRIFFDEPTALLSGTLMAIWPSQVAYVTVLASELPFTFFVLLGFAAWFSPRPSTYVRGVASGLAFAAASYVRPIALLMPVILWLSTVPQWRKLREELPTVFLALVIIAATIAPWSIRNTVVFGDFVLLSTNGGTNLWMGNNPTSGGFFMPLPASTAGLSESERDGVLGDEAKRYIIAEPAAFVLRSIKKAVLLHVGETIAVYWNADGIKKRFGENALLPLKLLNQGFWTGALLLAIAGLGIMMLARGIVATIMHPVVSTWIYFTAIYAVTVIQDRYHFPSHPFIAMLAAIAVLAATGHSQGTRTKSVEQ